MKFEAAYKSFYNRKAPPKVFIHMLADWGKGADGNIFHPDYKSINEPDIYKAIVDAGVLSAIIPVGVDNIAYRKAVMCEVLRVLAGFESSWNWDEGHDVTNPHENVEYRKSAGIFQISPNSIVFGDLKQFYEDVFDEKFYHNANKNATQYAEFRSRMRDASNANFILSYCARLLRFTIRHHGPIKNDYIWEWISQDAIQEFYDYIINKQNNDSINMIEEKLVWVLDAGHGGHDPGAIAAGYREKDIALKVVKELKNLTDQDERFKVYLTRADDTYISLTGRASIANKVKGKLLSVHLNSYNTKGEGLEIFTSKGQTKSDPYATAVVEEYANEFKDVIKTRYDVSDGDPDKEASFTVLTKTSGIAMLLELGFIDNNGDRAVMTHPDFAKRAARAIYKGMCKAEGIKPVFQDEVEEEVVEPDPIPDVESYTATKDIIIPEGIVFSYVPKSEQHDAFKADLPAGKDATISVAIWDDTVLGMPDHFANSKDFKSSEEKAIEFYESFAEGLGVESSWRKESYEVRNAWRVIASRY